MLSNGTKSWLQSSIFVDLWRACTCAAGAVSRYQKR